MLGRVTQRSIATSSLTNLQNAQARTAKLQEQLSSGKTLSKGSDDSVRAAAALRLNDQVAVSAEHERNVIDARGWTSVQEGALDAVVDALQSAHARLVQAGNGALDAKGRAAIAAELAEVKNTVLGKANTQHQGRAVFAGTTDADVAFDPTSYATKDDGGAVRRTVAPGVAMTVNINGSTVFGDGATSLFKELDDLVAAVTGNDTAAMAEGLTTLQGRIHKATSAMATIGARDNQLTLAEDANRAQGAFLTQQLDDVEGLDMAKAFVDFNLQNVAYQAALASTAKVIQPTLMDFLR
ncbi:flagellar hook-associated protein FlgL [Kineococcus sp. SYSU DK006]|uniref:flagellar hook-associated protein FlgL n=1 Tax=Kineococcus sp. SYSU DK006 TaxID=3383127 RepID=UPI003D7DE33A